MSEKAFHGGRAKTGDAAVVVAAGGSGSRMGGDRAKQYLRLGDAPLLVHALRRFEDCPRIRKIVLVVPGKDISFVTEEIVNRFGLGKVSSIVSGGAQRQDSVRNGLSVTEGPDEIVLVHDGARPFVPLSLIEAVIEAARETGAACPGVPIRDTVKAVDRQGHVRETLDRSRTWAVQTPQGFRREILLKAFRKADGDGFYGTDESSLVERMGHPVRIIPGAWENVKITTREDLLLGEFILTRWGEIS